MAKKAEAQQSGAFPEHLDSEKLYHVVVKQQFEHAKMQIRPGTAMLRGDMVDKYRSNLVAAWLEE